MGLKLYLPTESSSAFSEWHLQMVWRQQRWFRPLTTNTGASIQVIAPGIWNQNEGPDFLHAHLIIDGQPKRGHVELHLDAKSWVSHGHCRDERYDETILHICLWPPPLQLKTYTHQNKSVPLVILGLFLTLPLHAIAQLVETPHVLSVTPGRYGRCHKTLFSLQSPEKNRRLLEGAALLRLKEKWGRVGCHKSEERQLEAAVGASLGLPKDQDLFLSLYCWLDKEARLLSIEERYALALGVCGFFKRGYRPSAIEEELWGRLKKRWSFVEIGQKQPFFALSSRKNRPFHSPERRLLALASLFSKGFNHCLGSQLRQLWASYLQSGQAKPLIKSLMGMLPEWQPIEGLRGRGALFGSSLRKEIILNAFLPFLYANVVKEGELEPFLSMYRSIDSPHYGILDYLKRRFFGATKQGLLLKQAIYAQGCLQLHRDFCSQYESSCVGCPFVERCLSRADSAQNPH